MCINILATRTTVIVCFSDDPARCIYFDPCNSDSYLKCWMSSHHLHRFYNDDDDNDIDTSQTRRTSWVNPFSEIDSLSRMLTEQPTQPVFTSASCTSTVVAPARRFFYEEACTAFNVPCEDEQQTYTEKPSSVHTDNIVYSSVIHELSNRLTGPNKRSDILRSDGEHAQRGSKSDNHVRPATTSTQLKKAATAAGVRESIYENIQGRRMTGQKVTGRKPSPELNMAQDELNRINDQIYILFNGFKESRSK